MGEPQRGDVVVFRYPKDPSVDYIKRVVGLPGDRIGYVQKQVYVNGQPVEQQFKDSYTGVGAGLSMSGAELRTERLGDVSHDILIVPNQSSIEGEVQVPAGHYFVMGDNRDNSNDSRFWGFVPEENLVGKAFMIWMSWDSANGGIGWSRIGLDCRCNNPVNGGQIHEAATRNDSHWFYINHWHDCFFYRNWRKDDTHVY